jgi:type II secretory pathway predicted ATPase ExeA
LAVAGGSAGIFLPEAVEFIHARTGGVPRLLNQICDFALVYAFAEGRKNIDVDLIAQVVRERQSAQLMPVVG